MESQPQNPEFNNNPEYFHPMPSKLTIPNSDIVVFDEVVLHPAVHL